MRWILASLLVSTWALGVATAHTWEGLIHIVLLLALAIVAEQLLLARQGRPTRRTGSARGALK